MQVEYIPHTEPSFMADELKPCPFCGGKAELDFKGNAFTRSRTVVIRCKKCRVNRVNMGIKFYSEAIALTSIEAWNKRVQ